MSFRIWRTRSQDGGGPPRRVRVREVPLELGTKNRRWQMGHTNSSLPAPLLLPLAEGVSGHLSHLDLAGFLLRLGPAFPLSPVVLLYLPDDKGADH